MDDMHVFTDVDCFKPYIHQVAGHKGLTGLLSTSDGYVLKQIQRPPKGGRERDFYEWLYKSKEDTKEILQLRRFLPKYFGTVELKCHTELNARQYLKLEEITNKFRFPCVMDVKIGKVTWDHTADQEKINRRKRKWPLQTSVGFSILGYKVYNYTSGVHDSLDKCTCKSLTTTQEVNQVFAAYLRGAADGKKVAVVGKIISRLLDIKKLFKKQKLLKFIASSLLIVYEGGMNSCQCHRENKTSGKNHGNALDADKNHSHIPNSNLADRECVTSSKSLSAFCDKHQDVEVRMIDMTHVFESSELDENYMFGLDNLISHFEIQKEC